MDIRQIIIDSMAERGVTQTELAEWTGMTRPRVNAYLRGHRDVYAATLTRILEALELDIRRARPRRKKGR
jgi:transcriptional regulator with XRE-family HTH domain